MPAVWLSRVAGGVSCGVTPSVRRISMLSDRFEDETFPQYAILCDQELNAAFVATSSKRWPGGDGTSGRSWTELVVERGDAAARSSRTRRRNLSGKETSIARS